ncbi:unnamed protein product [Amoebophrya sp. A120]|nr:unnamed protein product [Amoebophrya sp. A120]|eukprot:GSA120T00013681001.1
MKRSRQNAGHDEDQVSFVNNDTAPAQNDVDMIDVNFEFYEPFETDFHGVRQLLNKSFEWCKTDPIFDLTEVTDVCCNQGNIGTVLKTTDQQAGAGEQQIQGGGKTASGEQNNNLSSSAGAAAAGAAGGRGATTTTPQETGLFGITTAVNLKQYKSSFTSSFPSMKRFMKSHLVAKGEEMVLREPQESTTSERTVKVEDLFEKFNTGFLINERLINLPEEVAPPLHSHLETAIHWSQTTPECPEDERPFYFFDYFLGIAKAFKDSYGTVYPNFEEEEYVKNSCFHKEIAIGQLVMQQNNSSSRGTSAGPDATTVKENEYRVVYLVSNKTFMEKIMPLFREEK